MKKISTLLLATFFSVTGFGQHATDADSAIILQNIRAFSANLVNSDFQAVADAYTDDGKLFPNGMDILSGKEAILKYWTPAPGRKSRTVYHEVTPEEIRIIGDEAYDWGYYEGTTRREDGTEINWRGKYVIVWKKQKDGQWKIYLDIWNRIEG